MTETHDEKQFWDSNLWVYLFLKSGSAADVISMTRELTSQALLLKKRFALSWFDALICAAALASGCDQLLTEDLQHGLVIEGKLTVLNPFLI